MLFFENQILSRTRHACDGPHRRASAGPFACINYVGRLTLKQSDARNGVRQCRVGCLHCTLHVACCCCTRTVRHTATIKHRHAHTTNHKPQTTNHKPQTTNHKQQTTNHKQQTTNNRQQTTNNTHHAKLHAAQRHTGRREVAFGSGCRLAQAFAFVFRNGTAVVFLRRCVYPRLAPLKHPFWPWGSAVVGKG
jgi:hypothetical protein